MIEKYLVREGTDLNIDLKGKVAIVTGAGRGIGLGIAEKLAKEGVNTVVSDFSATNLESVRQEFARNGWDGMQCECDVRDAAGLNKMVSQVVDKYGKIDILVNNAGVLDTGSVETLEESAWDRSMDVNLKGVFLACKSVIPIMKRQKSGRILNAASFAAIVPSINTSSYAASKAGVVYFTRVLAGELGPWNITVNCYAPGMIPTEMNHFADAPSDRQDKLLDTLTLRRWGKPEEIANLICFLSSEYAEYITGTLIDVSGGKYATQMPRMAYEQAAADGEYQFE